MTSERILKVNLGKIKKAIADVIKNIKESERVRDDLFGEVLSQLNQEYDKMIGLVQLCKYELIFDDLIAATVNNEVDELEDEEDGDDELI